MVDAYWNGEPAKVRRVVVVVGETPFPKGWSRGLEGQERHAIEVGEGNYYGSPGPFYLDDENGRGLHKVTAGFGSPRYGHSEVPVDHVVREIPFEDPCRCGVDHS